jgi:hypothetical protein
MGLRGSFPSLAVEESPRDAQFPLRDEPPVMKNDAACQQIEKRSSFSRGNMSYDVATGFHLLSAF